jgi:hypothetical protein
MNADGIDAALASLRKALIEAIERGDDVSLRSRAEVVALPPMPPSKVCRHEINGHRSYTFKVTPKVEKYSGQVIELPASWPWIYSSVTVEGPPRVKPVKLTDNAMQVFDLLLTPDGNYEPPDDGPPIISIAED